ncbi:MAG: hypothetical protein P4L69_22075 [Desulfosporosinus sp.]|nr:hypothetical protein [Desulfosporosinus sp.]
MEPNCAVNNSLAEWITEAPQIAVGNYFPLPNYGTVNWQGSYSYGPEGTTQPQCACIANPFAIQSIVKGVTMGKNGIAESKVSDPTWYNTFTTTWLAP